MRRCRNRLTFYELAVLLVTFVGAVQAVRGVIWFALAAAAILPVALDGVLTKADVAAPRINRIISVAALAGLAVATLAFLARPTSWFVSEWPEQRVEAVRQATRDPSVRLWATDGTADWLLWRIPDLRGRIAYDVRFELYDKRTLDRIVQYGDRKGNWRRIVDGYGVVVVDERGHLDALRREPGARVVYRDHDIAVVRGSFEARRSEPLGAADGRVAGEGRWRAHGLETRAAVALFAALPAAVAIVVMSVIALRSRARSRSTSTTSCTRRPSRSSTDGTRIPARAPTSPAGRISSGRRSRRSS